MHAPLRCEPKAGARALRPRPATWRRYASAYLYFPARDREEQAAVLGEDPYSLGLRAMGKNIERAIQGSMVQLCHFDIVRLVRAPLSARET